jgi:Flp pilus assembly protein TadD
MTADLQRAELLLDLNRPTEAEALVRTALAEDPASVPALALLVRVLLAQERYDEALPVAYAVAAGSPDDEYGHRLSAVVLQNLGRRDESIRAARIAVAQAPGLWHTHYTLGSALLSGVRRRSATEALAEAEEAVRLAPHEPQPHYLAGLCLRHLGRTKAATTSFREAARLDPGHAGAVNELATLQLDQGRYAAAGRLVASGLATAPQETDLQRSHDAILLNVVAVLLLGGIIGGGVIGTSYRDLEYAVRLGIGGSSVLVTFGALWWVSRDLPQRMHAWPSLHRRSQGLVRLLVRATIAVGVTFLVLCVLPPAAASLATALSIGLLGTFAAGVLIVTVVGFARIIQLVRHSGR